MKLTPLDIRHKEFKRGMRGYVDEEVDEFLDQIADEFERLFKENIDSGERIENLEEQVGRFRRIEETLQKTLVSAQQSAEELKQNATKESQLILRDAELKARQLVNDSYGDKQRIEGSLTQLRGVEEEFRIRFKQMLEGFLKQVERAPSQAAEPKSDLNRQAEAIRAAISQEETMVQPSRAPSPAATPDQAPSPAARQDQAPSPAPASPSRAPASPASPTPAPASPTPAPADTARRMPVPPGPAPGPPMFGPAPPAADAERPETPREQVPGADEVAASEVSSEEKNGASQGDDLLVDLDTGVSDDEFKW